MRPIRAELDQAKAASDESAPCGQRIRAGQKTDRRAQERLQSGQGPCGRGKEKHCGGPKQLGATSSEGVGGREKPRGPNWSSCTGRQLPRQPTGPRPPRWMLGSQLASSSTSLRKARITSSRPWTVVRKTAEPLQGRQPRLCQKGHGARRVGGLDGEVNPITEERIEVNIDELLQAQTRVNPRGSQSCDHKRREISAPWCRRRNRSMG